MVADQQRRAGSGNVLEPLRLHAPVAPIEELSERTHASVERRVVAEWVTHARRARWFAHRGRGRGAGHGAYRCAASSTVAVPVTHRSPSALSKTRSHSSVSP